MTNGDQSFKEYLDLLASAYGGTEGLAHILKEAGLTEKRPGLEGMGGGKAAATEGLEQMNIGRDMSAASRSAMEAIIDEDLRPVIDVVDGDFTSEHVLWTQLSTDKKIHDRLTSALPSIGRIELPGHSLPYGGTGFVVGKKLIMTNRHVAEIFAAGVGSRQLAFRANRTAGIDFVREHDRPTGPMLDVTDVVLIHPYWDAAILEVDGLDGQRPLNLSLMDARELRGRNIAVVGYPAFDPRNPADVQQNLFSGRYGVKRLQPGALQGGYSTASFGKLVNAATHDCSTLGGNSGSAIIDLETGEVIVLHFGGVYHERNYGVPTFELARDQRVIDAGVSFAGAPVAGASAADEWWKRADAGVVEGADGTSPLRRAASAPRSGARPGDDSGRTLDVEIPIRIRISVGGPRSISVNLVDRDETAGGGESLEAMREPTHDTNYGSRKGYDEDFLNTPGLPKLKVPIPKAADPAVLAKTKSGDDALQYQNFSILMHAKRRLALVAASNVTAEQALRRPDPNKKYTRAALSDLAKGDIEKWFLDSRLDENYQLPDVFFTKDRKAFDKGHIVRREDTAWGKTYSLLKIANGDTYHVTNCSPQVSGFNQSSKGEDNWGHLENHVMAEAANERLCLFAGPVLNKKDRIFHGAGGAGAKILAGIPSRYWKVIVARSEDGLAAYGFVLEQDLDDVEFEFVVPDNFAPAMYPLKDIQKMTGVQFHKSILDADQYHSVRGPETAFRAGLKRKREP